MSSNQSKSNTGKESTPVQEYVIRVTPKTNKKYNVMRFSELDGIDFTKWKSVKLDREFNVKEYKSANGDEEMPKFGAGSVFGAEQREESRRKRYQKYASRHRPEDQPWILNAKTNKQSSAQSNGSSTGKMSSSRKFRGVREGGVTDNTSYYVFFQAHDGAFEAFPVSEWYKFAPIPKFKALTAEEAEEQFTKRDKILNFFTVMNKKKGAGELNDTMEDGGMKSRRSRKDFKTSDMDDWNDFGGMSADSDDDSEMPTKKKGKKRGSDDEGNESEPREESDDGDFDQREVDYMSDSSSGEDDEDMAERLNEELKGVEDEDALRQLVISDSEEEEENQNKEDEKAKEEQSGKALNDKKTNNESSEAKVKQERKSNSDSSDSSDEDIDDKFKSSIFMQKNEVKPTIKKEPNADQQAQSSFKRKLDASDTQSPTTSHHHSGSLAKRPKTQGNEVNLEETVKRYLMRKPITTTALIKNIRKMKVASSKEELVSSISQILKKLNPQKQQIQGKLYLYLNPKP